LLALRIGLTYAVADGIDRRWHVFVLWEDSGPRTRRRWAGWRFHLQRVCGSVRRDL